MVTPNGHAYGEEPPPDRRELYRQALREELYLNGFYDAAAALRKERLQSAAYYQERLELLQRWARNNDDYELEGVRKRG